MPAAAAGYPHHQVRHEGRGQPAGTGPYEFAGTKLTRCENWWRDTAPLVDFDEIALTVSSTAADVRDNFEYQKVNMVLTDPNSSAFAGFHNDYELWNEETTIMQYIGYNMNSPVFSNYGLRGAITFAIDREQLVEQTLGGFAVASTLPCSPNSRYYDVKLANSFAYDTGSYYDQLASASVEDATGRRHPRPLRPLQGLFRPGRGHDARLLVELHPRTGGKRGRENAQFSGLQHHGQVHGIFRVQTGAFAGEF